MVKILFECIENAKINEEKHNNNSDKYLFWNYEKQQTWSLAPFSSYNSSYSKNSKYGGPAAIQLLIEDNNILDEFKDGLYHFKKHRLRNTRISELLDVYGLSIQEVRSWVGHTSIQMTIHYHNIKENLMYEKMKKVKDLDLLKIDLNSNNVVEIDENEKNELIRWHYVRKNLDSVKVPFGLCFKPSNFPCKQQMNHCLTCGSFCTTIDYLNEYYEEIERVKVQIEKSKSLGRLLWVEKNQQYLNILIEMVSKLKKYKIVHKNGNSREVNLNA